MNKLRVLLYKEWRDQRALCIGGLTLCILLAVSARILVGERFGPDLRTHTVLPVCLCVFAVAVATEAIVRDAQNGVDRTLRQLSAPLVRVWLAKFLFTEVATAGCLAVLVVLESALRLSEHQPALVGVVAITLSRGLLPTAAIAAVCMACACVLRRSLPAALIGSAMLFVVPFLAFSLPIGRGTEWIDLVLGSGNIDELSAVVCTAALLAAVLAFRVRRPDALGLRRAAGAAIGAGVVLVPLVAGSARNAAWAFDILPFSRTAEIEYVSPSPDGKYLALEVRQMWTPRDNWFPLTGSRTGNGCRVRKEVWILDRATKVLREIDDRFRAFPMDVPWDSDGHLVTVSTPGAFGDGDYLAERVDVGTGQVISSHPETEQDSLGYCRGLATWCTETRRREGRVLRWEEKGVELCLPSGVLYSPSPQPGVVFHEDHGYLVRHELDPDSTTRLAELPDPNRSFQRISPDGRYLLLVRGVLKCILDARDGRVVYECNRSIGIVEWSRVPGRLGIFCNGPDSWCALDEDGTLTTLPVNAGYCQELDGEHLITFGCYATRIECVRRDGSQRETLYEARP